MSADERAHALASEANRAQDAQPPPMRLARSPAITATRSPPRTRCVVAATLLVFMGRAALAAEPTAESDRSAVAEALFRRGLGLMREGSFPAACGALDESQRIDPRAGTLFTLAECEAAAGRPATASAHYRDFLDLVGAMSAPQRLRQRERELVARAQLVELEARVAHLTVSLPPNAPGGVRVERDGVLLGAPSLGLALPVNPGPHVVVTFTPDGQRGEQSLELEPGGSAAIVIELPAPTPAQPVLAVTSGAATPTVLRALPMPPDPPPAPSHRRAAAGLAIAAGAAAVTAAALFAVAVSKRDAIERDGAAGRPYDEGHGNYRGFELAGWTAVGAAPVTGTGALWLSRSGHGTRAAAQSRE
jgi:hypothetical protein